MSIEHLVAEVDLVCTHWQATGTHDGPFLGLPPSGRAATWTGTWTQRLEDGRIVEGQDWGNWDAAGLMRQLGDERA